MNDTKKPILVLDLDQTLISAEPVQEFDFDKNRDKMKKFVFDDMENYYIIFHRPNLQKFLDFAFKNFRVMVWTAATKDYALFVIDKIIKHSNNKNRNLELILFSYHCTISEKHHPKKCPKDLTLLSKQFRLAGYDMDNVFIIDDYEEVHNYQKKNCILVKPFYFTDKDSEKDDYLLKLMDSLSEALKKKTLVKNFVPSITQKLGVK